jgi:hypothetical protein
VGADAVAEVEVPTTFVRGDIDDDEVAAVGAGLADAGVAVDGDVGEAAVGRGDDFMAGCAAFRDRGEDSAGDGIDDGEALLAFLRDERVGGTNRLARLNDFKGTSESTKRIYRSEGSNDRTTPTS